MKDYLDLSVLLEREVLDADIAGNSDSRHVHSSQHGGAYATAYWTVR